MASSWMLRATATPETFLTRGLARLVSRPDAKTSRAKASSVDARHPVELPADLATWIAVVGRGGFAGITPLAGRSFGAVLTAARANARGRAVLLSYLAGTVPFGATRGGELWVYVVAEPTSPSRGVIASLDPATPTAPSLVCRGAASFAVACALDDVISHGTEADQLRARELRGKIPVPGVAEQEAVRSAYDRASALVDLVAGTDADLRRAAKRLALRPFAAPHPPATTSATAKAKAKTTAKRRKPVARTSPIALGPMIEAFFRVDDLAEARSVIAMQRASEDAIVREAVVVLEDALSTKPRSAAARELVRRRELAARAARTKTKPAEATSRDRIETTRKIIAQLDALPAPTEPLTTSEAREEGLLALTELGDTALVPKLVARAVTGDVSAVDMLAAFGDKSAVAPLVSILTREPHRYRQLEAAVVRALATLGATDALPTLRTMLEENPMPSWREGIERSVLVRELVGALGTLRDVGAAPALHHVLDERGHEYRAILPLASWAVGRIRHAPALESLHRILTSPKEVVTSEAIWAVGEIGAAHAAVRERATAILEALSGLEPGAEMVRLTGLTKMRAGATTAAQTSELRRALERALWEPGFRQEETSKRRSWALRSLEELADRARGDRDPFFLGHEAVRHFVTRDDHRVRRAAEDAFAAWGVQVPATRRYYPVVIDELEERGGLEALHEALRDPLGVFRHNIATRLAERAHLSSVRPLAEATARLFAEPPTSAYEYDDAPRNLVAFVRAVATMNRAEGNDVLIDGLRNGNHQVRAVVAENAPDDARFVPELMAMLGDPRSFLRSRAEKSLASLGTITRDSDRPNRIIEV